MRRTLTGLVAAAALVAAGACSDGGGDETSDGGSDEEFCTTFQELVDAANSGETDSEASDERLAELEPPEEIADEWDQYLPIVREAADVDPNDAEAQAELQARMAEAGEAAEAIRQYLNDECGISGAGGGTAGDGG